MKKPTVRRSLSIVLLCALLLGLCGCQQKSAASGSDTPTPAPIRSVSDTGLLHDLQKDPTIVSHISNNRSLSTQRDTRTANAFRLFVENTETMAGFVGTSQTSAYQNSLNCLFDVMDSYPTKDAFVLEYDKDTQQVEWTQAKLDGRFRSKLQSASFYTGRPVPYESPFKSLSYLGEEAFCADSISVIVSNFIEPRYDLSALSTRIEEYFDRYPYSAACVMAMRSTFEGDFHYCVNNDRKTTSILENVKGFTAFERNAASESARDLDKAPFYMVIVGPEQDVINIAENMSSRLDHVEIKCDYSIYSNCMYQQELLESLSFSPIPDVEARKASRTTVRSYNTAFLAEHDNGYAYFSGKSTRVKTLDSELDNKIVVGTSTQMSAMSTNYDGVTDYYSDGSYDYTLYVLEGNRWVPAGKNETSRLEVTVEPLSGPYPAKKTADAAPGKHNDEGEEGSILANGRREILITARMSYEPGSALSREKVYRVEVRLHLNRSSSGSAVTRVTSGGLNAYSIPREEYDNVRNKSYGNGKGPFNWNQYRENHETMWGVLSRTPNLSAFLKSMEDLPGKYQDTTEMIEYIDFIFNVPDETAGK